LHKPVFEELALSAPSRCCLTATWPAVQDGLLRRVLPGDAISHYPRGGLFIAEDVPATQDVSTPARSSRAGPMFGARRSGPRRGGRGERSLLAEAGLTPQAFLGFALAGGDAAAQP